MASITKHPKSPYYTACYTSRDGRQLKRSTKSTDRSRALQIAIELEGVERKAKEASLTTTQLQKILNDVSEKINGDSLMIPSVETYLGEWLKSTGLRVSGLTLKRYEKTAAGFLETLGAKAQKPMTSVTPHDVEHFLNARLGENLAPRTVIIDLKTLSAAFKRAENYGIIVKNPVAAVRRPKEEASERGVFTHEEVQKLIEAAPDAEWQTLIILGYFVGARLSDCVVMKWDNVDPEGGMLTYTQQKTGKKVTVPMHYHVIEHITHLSEFGTTGFLSPGMASKRPGGRHGLSEGFKRIVARAGLDVMRIEGKGIRHFSRRTFHSLRHSFNTALANAGISQEVRMKLTGHSSMTMNNRYTHLDVAPLKNAMTALPVFGAGRAKSEVQQ